MYDMLPRRKTDLELMEERLTSHILSVLSEIKGGKHVAYTSWDGRIEAEGLYMPENNKPRCGDKNAGRLR